MDNEKKEVKIICELNNKHRDSSGAVWEKAENKLCKQQTCPKLTGKEPRVNSICFPPAPAIYLLFSFINPGQIVIFFLKKSENIRKKERNVYRGKEGSKKSKTIIAPMY